MVPISTRHKFFTRDRAIWVAVGILCLAAAVITFHTRLSWTALHTWLMQLSPAATIAAMALLPLAGFSIVAVDVIAGAKFGFGTGTVVIAGITTFHLLASYAIARSCFRERLHRFLAQHHEKFPHLAIADKRALSVLIALIPGPPYFARNYILALSEIPLRTYFWIAEPIYLLRSLVTLSVGDLTGELSRKKIIILSAMYLIKLTVCAAVVKKLPLPRKIEVAPMDLSSDR